jgi:hypothetical protein
MDKVGRRTGLPRQCLLFFFIQLPSSSSTPQLLHSECHYLDLILPILVGEVFGIV